MVCRRTYPVHTRRQIERKGTRHENKDADNASGIGLIFAGLAIACDSPATDVIEEDASVWPERSPWSVIFQTARAWDGRVGFSSPEGEAGAFRIHPIPPQETGTGIAVEGSDSVCSISENPGLGEARRFRDCMNDARDNDVCDSGARFEMHWDEDEEMRHIRCLEEVPPGVGEPS